MREHQQKEAEEEARLQEQLEEAKRRSEIGQHIFGSLFRSHIQCSELVWLEPEPLRSFGAGFAFRETSTICQLSSTGIEFQSTFLY